MFKLFLLTMLAFLPISSFANDVTPPDDQIYFSDAQSDYDPSDFAVPEDADATMATDEQGYDAFQRRPNRPPRRAPPRRQPPRRPPHRAEPWYFLGCTSSTFDCNWIASRWGFRDSTTQWDIRCRTAAYACYGRNRW